MRKNQKRKLIRSFIYGFLVGAFFEYTFLNTSSWSEAVEVYESVLIAGAALFTAWWTYNTFGFSGKEKETKEIIEALDVYHKAVKDIHLKRVLESNIEHGVGDTGETAKLIESIDLNLEHARDSLRRLNESAAYIADKNYIKLLFLVEEVSSKGEPNKISSEIINLKIQLKLDARPFTF